MEEKITKKQAAELYRQNGNKVVDDSVDGFVVLKDVNKIYPNRVQAVFDFNLSIDKQEFIVLVGPSGCGKSTTLRMIAGLEEISSGYLYIDKVMANYLESKDRDIAMVFQSYALYPNLSVYDNIGFGLKARHVPKDIIKEKVFAAAEILDLGPYLDRRPKELSGGQMQRVALGRAIVRDAKLFLMDEPLSNLDAKLRVQMRSEIVKLHKNINATTIYVTHDQTEAMTMADRIVIMNKGVVQQIASPRDIYNDPENVFVATFIGNPPMNVFKTPIEDNRFVCGDSRISLPQGVQERYGEYIAERRAFFDRFKKISNLEAEKTLIERIEKFISTMRKMTEEDRRKVLEDICTALKSLADEKGFISFDDEKGASLIEMLGSNENGVQKKPNLGSLKKYLSYVVDDLKNCDLAVASVLKKFSSADVFKEKSKEVELPQKTDKKKEKVKVTLSDENDKLIDGYIASYADAANVIYVGIRPEDIHFADDVKGENVEAFEAEAAFVEMLGSELCIYIDLNGNRIIMKTDASKTVKTGDTIKLCFDTAKIKLFDPVSCQRILR